jgi:hypothetical protein
LLTTTPVGGIVWNRLVFHGIQWGSERLKIARFRLKPGTAFHDESMQSDAEETDSLVEAYRGSLSGGGVVRKSRAAHGEPVDTYHLPELSR